MTNFNIIFKNPWLMLLLIPAFVIGLIPYFRINKKYRRTRNRITAMILFFTICLLSVSVLSGLAFTYEVPVDTNEMIILVDWSYSNRQSEKDKENFVDRVLANSDGTYKIAVITFGKDQVVAAGFDYDSAVVRQNFISRTQNPDRSASNISAALYFARDYFTSVVDDKKAGKIVLISDGIETDESAELAVMQVAASGIIIDTVYFPDEYNSEIQIMGLNLPDRNIMVDEDIKIKVDIQSSVSITNENHVRLYLYDNGLLANFKVSGNDRDHVRFKIVKGNQSIEIPYIFTTSGSHEIYCLLEVDSDDEMTQNNAYYTYLFIQAYDNILVIDGSGQDSDAFVDMMNHPTNGFKFSENGGLDVIKAEDIRNAWQENPWTLNYLRQWDEVVLVNINGYATRENATRPSDLPAEFFDILFTYVNEVGGGLLTIGGDYGEYDSYYENLRPHAYNRSDMAGTKFQQLLPVECVDYTPPIALMIVVDRSGSMVGSVPNTGKNRMEMAIMAVKSSLEALTYRDYVGLISFDNDASTEIGLTSIQNKQLIEAAADRLTPRGGTVYRAAIESAVSQLKVQIGVEKKHIMFISDGAPADRGTYFDTVRDAYKNYGITFSCFGIEDKDFSESALGEIVALAGNAGKVYVTNDGAELANLMSEDLSSKSIRKMEIKPFKPLIDTTVENEVVDLKDADELPTVGGIYPTKLKSSATQILKQEFVPLYAKWSFGNGKVGSWTSTLGAPAKTEGGIEQISWTKDFMDDPLCRDFIFRMVRNLLPSHSVRPPAIPYTLKEDNYHRTLSLTSTLPAGETYEINLIHPSQNEEYLIKNNIEYEEIMEDNVSKLLQRLEFDYATNRVSFEVCAPGIYYVRFQRLRANGTPILDTYTSLYTVFSYSAEYNAFYEKEDAVELMKNIALNGNGNVINQESPQAAFEGMLPPYLITINPRTVFIIIALLLFLLCIVVKRFKWKWPWEIIRYNRIKKQLRSAKQ